MTEKPVASIKTLARYAPETVYIGIGEYVPECVRADDGDYYLASDVDAVIDALRKEVAELRETLRDVTGVAICALFDSHREDTLREFSLQELARVIYVTAPLMKDGVTVESVYRRGYNAAIEAEE